MNTEQQLIELIKVNKDKYYRVAFSYVKNREDALDIVHNTIVKALQKNNQLHRDDGLEIWVYRILINESISFVRKSKNITYFDELSETQIPKTENSDVEQYITLYDAIDRLSPKLKTVIILRFFEDLKFCKLQ